MCGIAGIFRPDELVTTGELEAMAHALRHRGPDGNGIWQDGGIGLAHTRLAVVDLSERARQPMMSASGRLVLSFNGEIYNHRELRRLLERHGVHCRTTSDTEVLLEGLELWGEAWLDKLEGMFAFALWDREKRTLLLARDRAGEKPLFYLPLPGGGVAFGSEIKAIRAVASLGVTKDVSQIPTFLVHGYVPPPATFYKNVVSLEPAHVCLFEAGSTSTPRRYWTPRYEPRAEKISYGDARAELRSRMQTIVRDRFEADVPVGAFLSGGLDSATVVGVATRDLGRPVHTFSIGFEEASMDESADARLSANHLGSIHREWIVSARDLPSIELLVHHHDGPFGDSSALPTYLVSKMAREHVTVALTGDGGDEVFAGYPRFVGAVLTEQLPRWTGGLGERILGRGSMKASAHNSATRLDRARRMARSIRRRLPQRMQAWNAVFAPEELPDLLTPDALADEQDVSRFDERVFEASAGWTTLSRALHHNFLTYLPEDLLVKVDRCAMAVSLEARSPLLDRGLIDFAGGLPDHYKIAGARTKSILRDTFEDLFAPELLARPKRGFGVPLASWLAGPLRLALDAALRPSSAKIYDWVRPEPVLSMLNSTPLDAISATRLWSLWALETWLQSEGS